MSENELLLCTVYEQALGLNWRSPDSPFKAWWAVTYILYNRAKDLMKMHLNFQGSTSTRGISKKTFYQKLNFQSVISWNAKGIKKLNSIL